MLGPMETCFMPLTYLLIEVVGSPGGGSSGKTRSGNNTDAYSGISFRPGQNELAEADLRSTTVGCYPDQANGFGLLDTGTGSMEKVQITVGKLRRCREPGSGSRRYHPDGICPHLRQGS